MSHRRPVAVLFGGDGFAATKLAENRPADQLIHLPGRDLAEGLSILGQHGLTSLLVEGGARLAKAFLKAHLVDELVLLKGAPSLGAAGIRPFPSDPFEDLDAAGLSGWTVTERRVIGPDTLMRLAAPSKVRIPMFTGIVTAIGTVDAVEDRGEDRRFTVVAPYEADGVDLGASIAHDGVCLTVTSKEAVKGGVRYTFDASPETLKLTTLSDWKPGTKINLERSLRLGDEMGGHVVTGHVDGVATVTRREDGENAVLFEMEAPEELAPYIAKKGSVCLQGTSLTVNSVEGNRFTLMLIPHTLAVTSWGNRKVGDRMNIEIDLMARYAERLMPNRR